MTDDSFYLEKSQPVPTINDSFKKIIITNDIVQPYYDGNGIFTMNIFDFLLNPKSLDYFV